MNFRSCLKLFAALVCVLLAIVSFPAVECAKKSPGSAPEEPEAVIEEVTQKQLERILQEKDYVAVYWCKCPETNQTQTKCELTPGHGIWRLVTESTPSRVGWSECGTSHPLCDFRQ